VRLLVVVGAVLAIVAVATFPEPPRGPHGWRRAVLTPDGTDGYAWRGPRTTMTVRAPASNQASNLRTIFWRAETPVARNGTSCATWAGADDDLAQQGAALRIWEHRGRVRALTVTKNVFSGAFWGFNVHLWDSATTTIDERGAFDLGERFSFRGATQFALALPWRMCARTRADRLEFKVWRLAEPEPRWGVPGFGGSMRIPADAPAEGRVGWYIGHLRPGVAARFTGLGYGPAAGPPPGPVPPDAGSLDDVRDGA
jgi:hypothetical protein